MDNETKRIVKFLRKLATDIELGNDNYRCFSMDSHKHHRDTEENVNISVTILHK